MTQSKKPVLSFDEWLVTATSWSEHDCYEAGQQSRQAKIDELQCRIDGALEKCYTGIRKQGGDHYLELVENILKGDKDEN